MNIEREKVIVVTRILGQIYKREKYQTLNGDDIYILYAIDANNIFCAAALYQEEEIIISRCTDEKVIRIKVKYFLQERGLKK